MLEKLLQKRADDFINKLENSPNDELFNLYYDMAIGFDFFCVYYLNIYLN